MRLAPEKFGCGFRARFYCHGEDCPLRVILLEAQYPDWDAPPTLPAMACPLCRGPLEPLEVRPPRGMSDRGDPNNPFGIMTSEELEEWCNALDTHDDMTL